MIPDRHRVMIVDDDADMRSLLAITLQDDYEVFQATNGLDAMLKLTKYQPDVAIIDIMMPLMDGHELCRKIRENSENKEIPLIVLSALNGREDIKKGYECGANLYLTKPFDSDRLLRNVEISLESQPVRNKNLSIEQIEEREERYAYHMKRAIEKKKYTTESEELEAEKEKTQTPPPEPQTGKKASPTEHKPVGTDRFPRVEGITAPSSKPSEKPYKKTAPHAENETGEEQHEEVVDPFSSERSGIKRRAKAGETPPEPVVFTEGFTKHAEHYAPGEIVPRILLVDDDDDFLVIIRDTLIELYEVVLAHDGFEALTKIPEVEPDIFVIDAMMPRMSGYQLIDMIKGSLDTYFKPIILATAKGSARDRRLADEKGVNRYLVKPFPPKDMLDAVAEIIAEPGFRTQVKSKNYQEIMVEDGRRRAAQLNADQRKKMWEGFGKIESFLKDVPKEEKKKR